MLVFDNTRYRVHQLIVGQFQSNCYLISVGDAHCLLDPGGDAERIVAYLRTLEITSVRMIATHCHFDHIAAAASLIDLGFATELVIGCKEMDELKRVNTYSLLLCRSKVTIPKKILKFDSALQVELAVMGLEVMDAPGHTAGSIVVASVDKHLLFSGDTIVHNHCVSDMIPSTLENGVELQQTIRQICRTFNPQTLIFPGHGKLSKLGVEMRYNDKISRFCDSDLSDDSNRVY